MSVADQQGTQTTVSLGQVAEAQTGLRHVATSHWSARTLHAAVALGVFDALANHPMSAADLARTLGTHPRATELLLGALIPLGFIERRPEGYANSAVARMFLERDSLYYQGLLVGTYGRRWERWERLEEAVRRGSLEPDPNHHDADFVRSMTNSGSVIAPLVARKLDLSRVTRALDVGGGPGTYAIALARARPDLQVDVLDLEPATAVAREQIAQAGLQDRVRTITGNFHEVSFNFAPYEMILFSNVLHSLSTDQCSALLRKAFDALSSESQCVVNDVLLKDDKTGPLFASLFAMNMLVNTQAGATYSGWEVTDMMQTVGFIRAQIVPLEHTPYSMVVGARP